MVSDSLLPHGLQHVRQRQASLSYTNSQSLLRLISIESMMPSSHLNSVTHFSCPQSFLSIRVFSNELALCIRWPKYWSFSFSISLSSEYSGLISFRIDCPRNSQESSPAPQFKNINYLVLSFLYDPTLTSIHQFSSVTQSCLTLCDPVNRSTPGLPVHHQPLYMTTGKTLVLTVWTFVSKVMSLPFGTLSMSTLSPYKISPPIFLDDLISSVTGSDLCEIFLL